MRKGDTDQCTTADLVTGSKKNVHVFMSASDDTMAPQKARDADKFRHDLHRAIHLETLIAQR